MTDIQATAQPLAKGGQTASLGSSGEAASSAAFEGLFAVLEMIGAGEAPQPELTARLAAAMEPAAQKEDCGLASAENLADAGLAEALSGKLSADTEQQPGLAMGSGLPAGLQPKTAQYAVAASAPLSDPAPETASPRLSSDILARFSQDDLAHLRHQARRLLKDRQQASPNMEALVALLDEKLARSAHKKTGEAAQQNTILTENQTAAADQAGRAMPSGAAAQPSLSEIANQPAARTAGNPASNPLQTASKADAASESPAAGQPNNQPDNVETDVALPEAAPLQSGSVLSGETGEPPAGQTETAAAASRRTTKTSPPTSRSAGQNLAAAHRQPKAGQPAAEQSRLPQRVPAEPAPILSRPAELLAAGQPAGAAPAHPMISAASGKQLDGAELVGRKKRVQLNEAGKTDRAGPPSQMLPSAGSADRPGLNWPAAKPGLQMVETLPPQRQPAPSQPVAAEQASQPDAAIEGGAEERATSRLAGSPSAQPAGSAQNGTALQRLNMLAKGWQDNLVRQAEKALLEGRETVRLVLNPRHLGRLQLSLGLNAGEAHIQIQAESGAAAQLLGESEARLQQMLEAVGLRLASLNTGSGFGAGGQESRQQQEAENSSGRPATAEAEKNLTENLDKTDKEFLNILA